MKEVVIRFVGHSENHISLQTTPKIRTGQLRLNLIAKPGPNQKLTIFLTPILVK